LSRKGSYGAANDVRGDDRLAARAVTATTVSCGDGGSIYLSVGRSILVSAIAYGHRLWVDIVKLLRYKAL